MRKISKADLPNISATDVIGIINGGIQLVDAAAPVISQLFNKINDALAKLGNRANSPAGRLRRIEALEAKDALNKEVFKTHQQQIDELKAIIDELKAKG